MLSLDLPARPEAAGAARKALASLNGSLKLVSEARLRDAQLLVSELVANAVRHGGPAATPVALRVHAAPQVMRVEVADHGPGFEPARLRTPQRSQAGGWGLHIVRSLAHRWGVDRDPQTTVWFEIDRPQRQAPLRAHPAEPSTRVIPRSHE